AGSRLARRLLAQASRLWRSQMPDTSHAVASGDTWLFILHPGVQRLALVCPLAGSIVALDDGPVSFSIGARRGGQRGPVLGTLVVAVGFAFGVLVEGIECLARCIDQCFALVRLAFLRRC